LQTLFRITQPPHEDLPLEEGLRVEAELFGKASATEDLVEGATAFLEKRAPSFKGH
jgi:enoyl-CoA hydratase